MMNKMNYNIIVINQRMDILPKSLLCLTLEHSLDDPGTVERWLSEYPEMEECIPIALRHVLEVSDLPPVPFFSSAELLEHLLMLWGSDGLDDKLVDAANNGLTYLVAHFLMRGADIHVYGDNALRWAAQNGHTATVKLLLECGADIHRFNDQALKWAAYNGHTKTVNLLLDQGADIHAANDQPLASAAQNGQWLC